MNWNLIVFLLTASLVIAHEVPESVKNQRYFNVYTERNQEKLQKLYDEQLKLFSKRGEIVQTYGADALEKSLKKITETETVLDALCVEEKRTDQAYAISGGIIPEAPSSYSYRTVRKQFKTVPGSKSLIEVDDGATYEYGNATTKKTKRLGTHITYQSSANFARVVAADPEGKYEIISVRESTLFNRVKITTVCRPARIQLP